MAYQGLYSSKQANQMKTLLLLVLFPVVLGIALFGTYFFLASRANGGLAMSFEQKIAFAQQQTRGSMLMLLPIIIIWCVIAFMFQRRLLFAFAGANPVERKDEPMIYNIVENLCISRGLPTPKIGIIETDAMNAFALGWRSSDARVVFTRGLINRLDKREIEAVAAHELSHIINKDSLLMMVMVLYIGAIAMLGEILLRSSTTSNSENKSKNLLPIIGLILLLLGYIFYPLLRLAVSRRREFLADAGAVELTQDNQAMISALQKISVNPEVKLENKEMSAMFIANPIKKVAGWFQTHPSIEERIKALQNY
ncbi:MAG: M48 family metallopeptidase [bacterium]|nr:M48 family metallopeptidase [bacterium]